MLNDSIRVFLMVVEKKSFSKAAKALFLTQPAVSFQIQMLEEHYGTRLFDRVSRNIILTEAGELLYKYATEMSDMQASLEKDMQELNNTILGRLRIGASITIGEYIAPYILGNFKKHYPKVTLSLEVANSDEIEMAIHDTSLDIGLVEGPPIDKDLESIPFLDDELVVITSVDHPWSKLESISIFELDQYPYISREKGSGTRAEIEQHLKAAGFSPNNLNVMMRLGSTNAIKSAATATASPSYPAGPSKTTSKWAISPWSRSRKTNSSAASASSITRKNSKPRQQRNSSNSSKAKPFSK